MVQIIGIVLEDPGVDKRVISAREIQPKVSQEDVQKKIVDAMRFSHILKIGIPKVDVTKAKEDISTMAKSQRNKVIVDGFCNELQIQSKESIEGSNGSHASLDGSKGSQNSFEGSRRSQFLWCGRPLATLPIAPTHEEELEKKLDHNVQQVDHKVKVSAKANNSTFDAIGKLFSQNSLIQDEIRTLEVNMPQSTWGWAVVEVSSSAIFLEVTQAVELTLQCENQSWTQLKEAGGFQISLNPGWDAWMKSWTWTMTMVVMEYTPLRLLPLLSLWRGVELNATVAELELPIGRPRGPSRFRSEGSCQWFQTRGSSKIEGSQEEAQASCWNIIIILL